MQATQFTRKWREHPKLPEVHACFGKPSRPEVALPLFAVAKLPKYTCIGERKYFNEKSRVFTPWWKFSQNDYHKQREIDRKASGVVFFFPWGLVRLPPRAPWKKNPRPREAQTQQASERTSHKAPKVSTPLKRKNAIECIVKVGGTH